MSEHMAGVESLREMGSAVLRYRRRGCDRVSDHMASVDTRARARARKERGGTMMLARPHAEESGVWPACVGS